MSEYIEQLQALAKNPPANPVVVEEKVELDPKSQASSELPYHTAETEAIQAERQAANDIVAEVSHESEAAE